MTKEGKYLYEELAYELIGLGYNVFNRLKFGYQEKYYQRAYAQELTAKKQFRKEAKVVIVYNGQKIGVFSRFSC
jgi:GxxExxY protein